MIIADTNIVSELMKDSPHPGVLAWAGTLGVADLTISVVTVEEVDRGLGRLPRGHRRRDLENRWDRLLHAFADSIAPYDVPAARATARIVVESMDRGRPMSLADAQIAGICVARSATLATRNVRDFVEVGELTVTNPFDNAPE